MAPPKILSGKEQAEALRSAASALDHGRYTTAIKRLNQAFGGLSHLLHKRDDLPPMPVDNGGEPTNNDRAQWALRAFTQFARDTSGGDFYLRDLLCDLMHLCDDTKKMKKFCKGNVFDFDNELEAARNFYNEEITEKQEE